MRYCVDCRHYSENGEMTFAKCMRDPVVSNERDDLISPKGVRKTVAVYCSIERSDIGKCGPTGTLFEAKA